MHYNQDETGFFYQLLPKVSYIAPSECAKEARGTKAMRSKNRNTLAVSTNATRTHILLPYFIGKAKKPACWALTSPEERMKLDSTITSDPVCLILDNCSAHGAALPSFPGVEYVFLPPNVTAAFQPLNMGVLIAVKTVARKVLLLRIISNIENLDELRAIGEKQPNECVAGILSYNHLEELCSLYNIRVPLDYAGTPGGKACNREADGPTTMDSLRELDQVSAENDSSSLMDIVDALCASSNEFEEDTVEKPLRSGLK
eukprot:IDg883t1